MKRVPRSRAIKDYCLHCGGGSALEVTVCPVIDCSLWSYRMGSEADRPYQIGRVRKHIGRYEWVMKQWESTGLYKELLAKISKDIVFRKEKNGEEENVQSP